MYRTVHSLCSPLQGDDGTGFLRDDWGMASLYADFATPDDCGPLDVMPSTARDLAGWLGVVRQTTYRGARNPYTVVYRDLSPALTAVEVSLRLQGFLMPDFNLGQLGTWDG